MLEGMPRQRGSGYAGALVAVTVALWAGATFAVPRLGEMEVAARWTGWQGLRGLATTSDGFLWMATHRGLVRFDGERFQTMGSGEHPALVGPVTAVRAASARRTAGAPVGFGAIAVVTRMTAKLATPARNTTTPAAAATILKSTFAAWALVWFANAASADPVSSNAASAMTAICAAALRSCMW